uniref:phosphatidylinositol-3,5-bisphosphate 3-phosphatase n=1 Tax=Plectus sambesii TaxID=2011161 RepID=A0A914VYK7_9BILA
MAYSTFPAYTEDITVAGALLADRIGRLFESVAGKAPLKRIDLESLPNLTIKVEKVQLIDRFTNRSLVGTLYVTTTHVIFIADDHSKEIWVLHGLIGSVERGSMTAAGCPLTITCKNFLILSLKIARDRDCQDLLETLQMCSRPVNVEEVFAFSYVRPGAEKDLSAGTSSEWTAIDLDAEFRRQGVDNKWKMVDFNGEYQYCDTYPRRLMVPSAASTQTLIGSCQFRSRARLPVLTYWHRANSAAICRCAQPLTGFSARCVEDEQLMDHIAKANAHCGVLHLVDTRPRVNAMVNKVQGKGFEDERNYTNMRFHFFDIDNIHVMRGSLQKLVDACHRMRTVTEFWKGVESSGWLRHVREVLKCAGFLSDSVARGISCVVHCSDGWDRTAQTISVAQLLLDPYFRTIDGFRTLVEKDWLAFGHKFLDRCGHAGGASEEASKEFSPVFTQFLDVVWQVMCQYPRAFEFHERFLIEVHDHSHSGQFGTFLGNCDKDRMDLRLTTRTECLWAHLDRKRDDYLNPTYQPGKFSVLVPDTRAQAIHFWRSMYNRFDDGIIPRESIDQVAIVTLEHVGVLEAHHTALQARIAELKAAMGRRASLADSGHSSGGGGVISSAVGDNNQTATLGKSSSCWDAESGVYDTTNSNSLLMLDEPELSAVAVRWRSLRGVVDCQACAAHFGATDRRLHCYRCGSIFCRRCLETNADARLCKNCADEIRPTSPLVTSTVVVP